MYGSNHVCVFVYRLINTAESMSQQVDIGKMFREWSLQSWQETTPDFLKTTSNGSPSSSDTIQLSPLDMKSLVLHLQKS